MEDEEDLDVLIEEIGEFKHGKPDQLLNNLGEELYNKVQERMIEIFSFKTIEELANEVIDKMYGNGDERKLKLGIMYNLVQNKVNEILCCELRHPLDEKHIEILAYRTIDGEFDEGMERKEKLGKEFKRVQNKVNRIKNRPLSEDYDLNKLDISEYIKKLEHGEMTDDEIKKALGIPMFNFIRNKVNERNNIDKRLQITQECIDILADYTIKFEFDENEEREKNLGDLYPYVQNKVNEILGITFRHRIPQPKPHYIKINIWKIVN